MKETETLLLKPIFFSTPMVKTLLNTKIGVWPAEPIDASKPCKSQTRRVIIPQPPKLRMIDYTAEITTDKVKFWGGGTRHITDMPLKYKVGDILYVRETWADIEETSPGNIHYKASATEADLQWFKENGWKWKPSIHMPRKAARLFLEVKSVRVERLQDIGHADVLAEGLTPQGCGCEVVVGGYCTVFRELWNSINAKHSCSWESNLWVFVYEFMRVEPANEKDSD